MAVVPDIKFTPERPMRVACTARAVGRTLLAATLLSANLGGCVIRFDPLPDDPGNGGGDDQPADAVTIVVVNETGATIDPEIYVTDDPVTDPAQLFASRNKFTRFGVGNRGLLGDFDTDSFTLDCAAARVVGTKGALFGDDLENPDGVGPQRVFSQDVGFVCGETITFRFSRSGDSFDTTVTITR